MGAGRWWSRRRRGPEAPVDGGHQRARELEAGQVWRYRTRPAEPESHVRVLLVEEHPRFGLVAHVRVDGVRMPNPVAPERPNTTLGHLPITVDALRGSLLELVDHTAEPPDLEGYQQWRDAGGGVFTLPLADSVQSVEDVLTADSDPDGP